jgi:hypothetical protein
MNRKAKAKSRQPLAADMPVGTPIHMAITTVVLDTPNGPKKQFYWSATTDLDREPTEDEIVDMFKNNGPFDSEAEAQEAAKIAIVGKDCVVEEGGMWDPAWDKPQ